MSWSLESWSVIIITVRMSVIVELVTTMTDVVEKLSSFWLLLSMWLHVSAFLL